jgi:hypothetical protein
MLLSLNLFLRLKFKKLNLFQVLSKKLANLNPKMIKMPTPHLMLLQSNQPKNLNLKTQLLTLHHHLPLNEPDQNREIFQLIHKSRLDE